MKKILLLSVLVLFQYSNVLAQFAGGSGTEEDPYQIQTVEQLQEIRNHTDKHFIQIADIDASVTEKWNDGMGFKPIGDSVIPFTGTYDGYDFIISNLSINVFRDDVGLFGSVENSYIKNVTLENASLTAGDSDASGIALYLKASIIENCHISGEINGSWQTGGLVGTSDSFSIIRNSSANVDVSGFSIVGGLVGINHGDIIQSYTEGTVSARWPQTGGVVGSNRGLIEDSFSNSSINGTDRVGGLVGELNINGRIVNSYSYGNVNGNNSVGGLVGSILNGGIVESSYSTGEPSGNEDIGGLVGLNGGLVEASYWDSEKSMQSQGIGRGAVDGVTSLTTEQMVGINAFENMSAFDFSEIWKLTEGYPALYWEGVDAIPPPHIDPPIKVALFSPSNYAEAVSKAPLFEWNETDETNSYKLQVSVNEDFSQTVLDIDELAQNSLQVDSALQFNTAYFWRVKGVNLAGAGEWSEIWNYTTEFALPTPELVAPAAREEVELPITFFWNPVEGAEDYILEISLDESFDSLVDISIEEDQNSKQKTIQKQSDWKISQNVNNLEFDKEYYWRVKASNFDGASEWSDVWAFITGSGVPDVPAWKPDDGEENVASTPLLEWNESNRAVYYDIQLTHNNSFEELLIDVQQIEETQFQIENELKGSATYYWRVRAGNDAGYSDWSDVLQFTTEITTSTEFADLPKEFSLEQNYPNPFNPTTTVTFALPKSSDVSVEVFNSLGQRVAGLVNETKLAGVHEVSFDASSLSSGIYLIRMSTPEHTFTRKMTLLK